ncbi:dethiobiotin synthase [Thiohalocapsa marina]|uniref:ATP-dependent dethiobiotin synthetase BioD n=1 Tax=Thiohalocapsa marina TaxID=424902 RepID=A0A5M8FVC6_9GAMM|nr:dethiobiotin synthase [Thiohalocapsa marina]KAA6187778.1 dethiobiotin synthase [Thiohalocapsa marina]
MSGVFITGTDTDVGKTEVSLGLMHALQGRGCSVLGMKPVASGGTPTTQGSGQRTGQGIRCADALRLQAQGSWPVDYAQVNPYAFAPAIAPHIAAGEAGVEIALAPIRAAYDALAAQADWVVVEGVGGWRVPLGASLAVSDLPRALDLPVLLVVGLRLGCINHSLLTAESIRAGGGVLTGWIGVQLEPHMPAADGNIATLCALIDAPNLGIVPYLPDPDAEQVAEALLLDPLLACDKACDNKGDAQDA